MEKTKELYRTLLTTYGFEDLRARVNKKTLTYSSALKSASDYGKDFQSRYLLYKAYESAKEMGL